MQNPSVSIPVSSAQWSTDELIIRPLSSADIPNVRALHVCPNYHYYASSDLHHPPGGAGTFLPSLTPYVLPPTPYVPDPPLSDRDLAILRQAHRLHSNCPARPYL